jgi:hypothetical protein
MVRNGYLCGADAVDVARMAGVQLYRVPACIDEPPDTSWATADAAIAAGEDPGLFFIDLDRLKPEDAGTIILSLIGIFKAWHDSCMAVGHD